jgi:hypothetical protein
LLTDVPAPNTTSCAAATLVLATPGWLENVNRMTAVFCAPNVFGTAAASTVTPVSPDSAIDCCTRVPRTRTRSPRISRGIRCAKCSASRSPEARLSQ